MPAPLIVPKGDTQRSAAARLAEQAIGFDATFRLKSGWCLNALCSQSTCLLTGPEGYA